MFAAKHLPAPDGRLRDAPPCASSPRPARRGPRCAARRAPAWSRAATAPPRARCSRCSTPHVERTGCSCSTPTTASRPGRRRARDAVRRAGHAAQPDAVLRARAAVAGAAAVRDDVPPDVVVLHTSRRRTTGVSLGTEVNVLPAAIEACRARGGLGRRAGQPRRCRGPTATALLDPDDGRLRDRGRRAARRAARRPPPDDAARRSASGSPLASPDGATLQLGIGAVPDATLPGLTGRRGLRDLVGDVLRRRPRPRRRPARSTPPRR